MIGKQNRYTTILPSLAFLLLVGYFFLTISCQKKPRENPFDFTLDHLMETDETLICFTQTTAIPLPFDTPRCIAAGADGRIYAAGDQDLIAIDEIGNILDRMELNDDVYALAVLSRDRLFAGYTRSVETINLRTKERFSWAPLDEQAMITSIAATETSVFIADAGNKAVLCYNTEGALKRRITGEASHSPHFIVPSPYFDVAAGPDHTFWVTNPGRYRVEQWSVEGKILGYWGTSGIKIDEFCGCCNPVHIALLPPGIPGDFSGTIVTAEKGIPRVKLYQDSGEFLCVAAPPEIFRIGTQGLDIAVGKKGQIYILDPDWKMIRVFKTRGAEYGKE
jgi:hypothetical protein